jgi:hypothetical protein
MLNGCSLRGCFVTVLTLAVGLVVCGNKETGKTLAGINPNLHHFRVNILA